MKTPVLFWLMIVLFFHSTVNAQTSQAIRRSPERTTEESIINARHTVHISFAQNQLLITNLQQEDFDRIIVFNMRGAVTLQQTVREPSSRLDLTSMEDGVYLLVLRSSATMKEKTMKFVVRK
jgi:hypothetical protein